MVMRCTTTNNNPALESRNSPCIITNFNEKLNTMLQEMQAKDVLKSLCVPAKIRFGFKLKKEVRSQDFHIGNFWDISVSARECLA